MSKTSSWREASCFFYALILTLIPTSQTFAQCSIVSSGLVLHLEADLGVSATGSTVTAWADQSGNANDLNASGDPQLVLAGLNGNDYIAFDGTGDWLDRTTTLTGLPTGNGDRTMFAVIRYTTIAAWAGAAFGTGSANDAYGLAVNGGGGNLTVQGWGGGNDYVSVVPGTGQGWLSQSASLNSGSGIHYLNGSVIDTYTHTYTTGSTRISIGEEIGGAGNGEEIDVALVLVYDRTLTPSERQSVEDYIQQKYFATPCPTGLVSDDFCPGSLDPAWTFEDPLADGSYQFTGPSTSDAWLEISVPAGSPHEIYTSGIQTPALLQNVNDTDFEVEVKFESPLVTPQYQQQGIVVRESANKFLRFEFYSKSPDNTFIYSQAFDLPSSDPAAINTSIGAANISPLYMRVKREGDQWTQTYSLDSTNWLPGASFTYAMTPLAIGPYAGNAAGGSSPAHTAQIDYFMDLADPIIMEDGCTVPQKPVIGPIADQMLEEGTSVSVNITATDPDGNDADLVFTSIGLPAFALLTDNGNGTAQLDLDPLAGDAGVYPVSVIATDLDLLADTVEFVITVTLPGGISYDAISDDFCSGTLEPQWAYVDPLGDGTMQFTGSMTSDAWLELSVPASTEHQLWTSGIQAPHIIQNANDSDLVFTVKLESPVEAPQYQEQGMLFKENDFNFLRFEIYSTNSNTNILAATLSSPGNTLPLASNITINTSIQPLGTAPIYMRVERTGDLWTQSHSLDGTNWTVAGSFSYALDLTKVGLYGGNGSGGGSPAHTAQFDYFESTDNLITDEDNCPLCAIASVVAGAQSTCDDNTNQYTQEVTVSYVGEPASGMLDINGQLFPITGSPQTETLTGLVAHGAPVDVEVSFSDEPGCNNTFYNAFMAPASCQAVECAVVTSGLVLHLESGAGISKTAGNVSGWDDQSGQANHMNISAGDPQFVSVGGPNNRPFVEFDGTDDHLERTATLSGLPSGAGERSAFMVVRYQSNGWGGFAYGNAGTCGEVFGLVVKNDGDLTIQRWCGDKDSNVDGTGEGWLVQSVIMDGSNYTHYKDGTQIDNGANDFTTVASTMMLGAEIDGNPNVDMDVSEVLVYDRAVTEMERQDIENYLQNKYFGVACPAACMINSITAGTQTACVPGTNTYTQEVIVTYTDDPGSGTLDVNGQSFAITGSPQTVVLTGLPATGIPVDVTAQFSDEITCTSTEIALFTAPVNCEPAVCYLSVSGLVLHLESGNGISTSAGNVSGWTDQSGQGNDLDAPSGDPKVLTAGGPNGEPFIEFDGTDDALERLASISGLPTGNTDRTMFAVMRYNTVTTFAGATYGTGSCGQAWGMVVNGGGGNLTVQGYCAPDFVSGTAGTGQGWLSQSAVFSSGTIEQFLNGTSIGSAARTYSTTLGTITLGKEIGGAGDGEALDIAAVLVFDRALTTAERQTVEAYIQERYFGGPACCTNDLELELQTDNNGSETSWEIYEQGGSFVYCSGNGYPSNNTIIEDCCLPDGCYALTVYDSFGDGMCCGNGIGGYILRTASGDRIIDNGLDGEFTSESAIHNNNGFCLPLGSDRVVNWRCDIETWIPSDFIQVYENPAVSAEYGGSNHANSGYQYWFFNPDGGYSRRIFYSHANASYIFPYGPTRATYMRFANIISNPIPADDLLNVTIRNRIAGVNGEWGTTCRVKIDLNGGCPITELVDDVLNPKHSCGLTNVQLNGSTTIHANPVSGANKYQFEFSKTGHTRRIASPGSALAIRKWWTSPLQYSSTYNVRVHASFDNGGSYCPWGTSCTIEIGPEPPSFNGKSAIDEELISFGTEVSVYPNPVDRSYFTVDVHMIDEHAKDVSFNLIDQLGRVVVSQNINEKLGSPINVELPTDLINGVYSFQLMIDGERSYVEKLILHR